MNVLDRQKRILSLIIEQYIKTGEPVGSKLICQLLPMAVSSATVRNEMSTLSEQGFLEQRHTSGGRVPSHKAYRYYIDNLMLLGTISDWEIGQINSTLSPHAGDPERLLMQATKLLAKMTGCAAFYTKVPDRYDAIQGVELIPAGARRAMLVMLTTSGIVKSAICITDGDIDERFKAHFYSIVKKKLIGTPLTAVNVTMIQNLAVSLGDMVFPMVSVLISLSMLCSEASKCTIFVDGETNLLAHAELGETMYPLLSFLTAKEQLQELLNAHLQTGNEKEIFIGRENGQYELDNSTTVLSKYYDGNKQGGVIGIIGSTRLDYEGLIPKFEYLANLVDKFLSERGAIYE